MKDKKALIFYFLMGLILLDFGNQLKKISYNPYFQLKTNPVFSIVHVNNSGGAFSLFQNGAQILAILGIIVILFLIYYVYKNISFKDKFSLLSITLFSAGVLGNLIERIKFGYVVDYIKLNFINFPVFNSFDIMICVGIILYVIFVLIDFKGLNFKWKRKKQHKSQ